MFVRKFCTIFDLIENTHIHHIEFLLKMLSKPHFNVIMMMFIAIHA